MTSKKTGIVFFPAFDWAISPTHPEREERLLYTRDQIFEEGVMDLPEILEYPARLANFHDISRVHFCVPDTQSQVTEAHRIAAGAAIQLADHIVAGDIKNGFALVRPPGHHAMRVVHGNRGFCNINNEAIMIEYIRRVHGVKRVAVIDTDVHHGDGTQDIYFHDPDVLFISFHQDGRTIYPGTGFTNELGGPGAYATTINIPLPPGVTDNSLHYITDNLILPILADFKPDFLVNSAGQDNHYSDPLGEMLISAQGYARLTEKLKPQLAVLEGGYAIESALPYVNLAILLSMAGKNYNYVQEPDYDPARFHEEPAVTDKVHYIVEYLQKIWRKRSRLDKEILGGEGRYWQRTKSIFYDTDSIEERQLEKVRLCPSCPGYLVIDSQARHEQRLGERVLCISIPIRGCRKCQEEAWALYEQAKKDYHLEHIYLQDKSTDTMMSYSRETDREFRSDG